MNRRVLAVAAAVTFVGAWATFGSAPSLATPAGRFVYEPRPGRPPLSGVASRGVIFGSSGAVSGESADGAPAGVDDDIQVNGDNKADPADRLGSGAGLPANETAIAINPRNPKNVIASANDYEPAVDSVMGIYVSFDGGHTWPYSRHTRQVVTPESAMYASGDPVVVFDSDGTAHASFIAFGRDNCDSYIAVIRSEDHGVTWSAPYATAPEGTGVIPGDGIVAHNAGPQDCRIFHDKEWMTAGPRPAGVPLVPGTEKRHLSPDRLYVTWSRFDFGPTGRTYLESPIYVVYSDDQGRHWSAPAEISGKAPFCDFQTGDPDQRACDEDQFSVPVVDPRTGHVYVAFENFNVRSTEKNQYLVVESTDGGMSWSTPRFITDVYDGEAKYPTCNGRQTLDLMCARTNAAGNIGIDVNTGRLYLAFADNRNGSAADTNTDVLVTTSSDGGRSWTKVREITGESVDDQWFPWLSVAPDGTVAVAYFDRRYRGPKLIDTSLSVSTDQGASFQTRRVSERSWNPDLAFRLGLFIGDYNGLATTTGVAIPCWTDARFAEPNVLGNNPPKQQSDIFVDVERIPAQEHR